ncbi:MAG TPA: hypothetical protein VIN06_13575 [Devosia sp.]
MAVVHRDARTDHLPESRLTRAQLGMLGDIFELALQDQEFARMLAEQVGAIARRSGRFKNQVKTCLKGGRRGNQGRLPEEEMTVLADFLEAREEGLTVENAYQSLAIRYNKSASTIEDIVSAARLKFPNLRVRHLDLSHLRSTKDGD